MVVSALIQQEKVRISDGWLVRSVPLSCAQYLTEKFHYSMRGSNTGVFVHGLIHKGKCYGIAWWIPPTKTAAKATYPEGDWTRVLSLSRLVCIPEAPKMAASFLIGRSIRIIKKSGDWDCLVTYAHCWKGHTGAIYKATNWEYLGLTPPEPVWIDGKGRSVSRKAGPKTRTVEEMKSLGYQKIGSFAKHKYRLVIKSRRNTLPSQMSLF